MEPFAGELCSFVSKEAKPLHIPAADIGFIFYSLATWTICHLSCIGMLCNHTVYNIPT